MNKILKSLSVKMLIATLFIIIGFSKTISAQAPLVKINVMVLPPYSTNYNEYTNVMNRVVVTLQNNSLVGGDVNVLLRARFSNDDISITSDPAKQPLQPFTVSPGVIRTLTINELREMLGVDNVLFSGITKFQLLNQGLPEGSYTLCIEAYWDEILVSGPEPMGCSNMFSIRYLDPPTIMQPLCSQTINATNPQQLIFSWAPPAGAPMSTFYILRMTEVMPEGRSPYDAILSATYPYFFEEYGITGTSFIYTSAKPTLTKGRIYAFEVGALDHVNHTLFRNSGKSEICWFKWGVSDSATINPDTIPVQKPKIPTVISGTLNYSYQSQGNPSFALKNTSVALKVGYKKIASESLGAEMIDFNPIFNYTNQIPSFQLQPKTGNISFYQTSTGVSDVSAQGHYAITANNYAQISPNLVGGIGIDHIVTTNSKGEFSFNLMLDAKDTVDQYILNPQNPNEKLYKYYYLQIYNPYYDMPTTEFQVNPGQNKELGVIVNKVKTYQLNVNVRQFYKMRIGKTMEDFDVYLLRKTKGSDLPEKEGDLEAGYSTHNGYIVIAKATTGINPASVPQNKLENSVTFSNLVKNISPGDNYILYACKHSNSNFPQYDPNEQTETHYLNLSCNPSTVGNVVPTEKRTIFLIYPNPPHSTVKGKISYKYLNNDLRLPKPLANTSVSLIVQYKLTGTENSQPISRVLNQDDRCFSVLPADNNVVLKTVTTNQNGEFSFDFANIDSVKIVNPNFSNGSAEVDVKYKGKLERVIRLRVNNSYYCSPDEDILVQPWSNFNINLTSYIMSYQLKLKAVIADAFKKSLQNVNVSDTSGAISGITFTLYRNFRDSDIPSSEGMGMNTVRKVMGKDVIVVSEGKNMADGTLIFNDLIRSNYPSDIYMIIANTSQTSTESLNYWETTDGFPDSYGNQRINQAVIKHPSNVIIYNSDYTTTLPYQYYTQHSFEKVIKMSPRNPRVAGRVISKAAPNGVKQANLTLYEDYVKRTDRSWWTSTDTMGYFKFNDLNIELLHPDDYLSNVIGPSRILQISRDGYKTSNIDLGIMKRGTQYYNPLLELVPLGTGAFGIVRDSIPNINNGDLKGDPIVARVKIGDGAFINTYNQYPSESPVEAQKFKVDAAFGIQKLTIIPFDPAYSPKTFTVNITQPKQWLGVFEFDKLKHKVKIKVVKNMGAFTFNPIVGAKVKLLNMEKITNTLGEVYFEYTNNSITNFVAEVIPNSTQSFVPKTYAFTNTEAQGLQKLNILVEDGAILKGRVISAVSQFPLKNAKVFVDQGNGNAPIIAFTDNYGIYQINGVPRNPNLQVIRATYSGSNSSIPQTFIGKSTTVLIPATGNPADVNFSLNTFTAFDISSLLGMPIEIDSLVDLGNSLVQINGAFVNIKSNANFKLMDSTLRIPFVGIRVGKGPEKNAQGLSIGVPLVDNYGLDIYNIPIHIFDNFNGRVRPRVSVLHFEKDYPSKKGKITGLIQIVDNSFNFPSSYMTISNTDFYLGDFGKNGSSSKTELAVFKAAEVPYPKSRFSICKYNGSGFEFKLLGFEGITGSFQPSESYIIDDTVALYVRLKTNLPFNPPIPLDIDAGKVILHHDKIDPIDNYNDLDFKLETWNVKGNGWKLATNSGGILIKSGAVKTGIIDVPFTNMTITPTDLLCENFKVNDLTIGGVTPLMVNQNIPASNKIFIYDPRVGEDQKGHYKFLILSGGAGSVANFGGGALMEGMQANDRFNIYVISMLSSGEQIFSFGDNHPAVPIYNVAKFKPLTISAQNNSFSMLGTVDFDIPRTAKNYQCNLIYKKGAPKATVSMMPVGLVVNGPGGVTYSAGSNQSLNAGGYTADGTIEENGIFKFNANLFRPSDFNNIKIKVDSNTNQTLKISSTSEFQKIYGNMGIKNNDWDYFTFGGTMIGAKGIGVSQPQKLNFTVFGDIKADNQSIGVQNVDLPGGFGGISLTYDFKNSCLTGGMEFNAPFNGVNIHGLANILFDNLGWYFIAGGSAQLPSIGTANAGILIGDYPQFTPAMQNTLMQFCYNKNVPCDYKTSGIHGFFLSGTKSVPVVNIPNIHLNILVASMDLGFDCGVDARMYMNFTNQSTLVGFGAMAYAHAYFALESCFCTSISADLRQELFVGGLFDFKAKSFNFTGCGSISISGQLEQCIGAFGLCGPCISAGVSQSLKLEMSVGSSSGIHGLSVGIGNCSSPSPDPCK